MAAFCYISLRPLLVLPVAFLFFVWMATAFAYSYMRLVQLHGYGPMGTGRFDLKTWTVQHPVLTWFYTLFFGLATFYFFWEIFSFRLAWWLIFPGIVSLLYPISFKNAFSGFTSLRTVPGLKMFAISLTWAYVTVLVPHALYGEVNLEVVLEFLFRSVLMMGLVIPFDIRDETMDDPAMHTLPQAIGTGKARSIALFFVALYQLWLLAKVLLFGYPLFAAVALVVGFEIGFLLIKSSGPARKEHYYSFWLEATPIFAALLLVLELWLF